MFQEVNYYFYKKKRFQEDYLESVKNYSLFYIFNRSCNHLQCNFIMTYNNKKTVSPTFYYLNE